MPVIPPGIPPFAIRPPCTAGDTGAPTDSLLRDVERVFLLIEDERHLTAQDLLQSVRDRLTHWDEQRRTTEPSIGARKKRVSKKEKDILEAKAREEEDEFKRSKAFLRSKQASVDKLENRCRLFRRAQQNLNQNEDWTFASNHFGITTYYRREADESLSLKLEGEVKDAALFEQVCVLKEVDLHYKWAPFCSSSLTIADLDKLDLVGWFLIGMPNFGMARDGCFRAVGCDNIQEDGSILLAGQGIRDIMPNASQPDDTFLSSDPILEKLDIPPIPTRAGSGRMTIRKFEAVIHITSPTSCNTRIVANIDPNISLLPTSLLEFIMKHMTGVLLAKLQTASKKAVNNPVTNVHAVKMREEREFYQRWLMAKFQSICESKGWEMPQVAAFQLAEPGPLDPHHGRLPVSRSFAASTENPDDDRVNTELSKSINGLVREVDNVSLLSNRTGNSSGWSSNPISNYLREVEAKVQRRKDDAVAAIRKRAADILIPKKLPPERHERLTELRTAKARRVELAAGKVSDVVEQSEGNTSIAQRLAFRLFNHGTRTRSVVVVTLVSILFLMLHPEALWQFSELSPSASRGILVAQDCLMMVYILLCALPHFLLCDAALVYAFDALELGSKTGHHVKTFYSDNVRSAVFMASLGIVFASITKALCKVWFRVLLWSSSRSLSALQHSVSSLVPTVTSAALSFVPPDIQSIAAPFLRIGLTITNFAMVAILRLLVCVGDVLLMSNPLGRTFADGLKRLSLSVKNYVMLSLSVVEGTSSQLAWRIDAFHTARTLFLYTSVFLVTTLVLFHLTTTRPPAASESVYIEGGKPVLTSIATDDSGEVSLPAKPMQNSVRSLESIPEASSAGTVENGPVNAIKSIGSDSVSSTKRRRFRFRDSKTESAPLITTTAPLNAMSKTRGKRFKDLNRLALAKSI